MFKRPNYPDKLRFIITYVTLDISYDDDKKVRIRKIHKGSKSEELKKSKYIIGNDETYIYDNQIDLEMFSFKNSIPINLCLKAFLKSENEEFQTQFMDFSKYDADFFRIEKSFPEPFLDYTKVRVDIFVSIKNPDEQLNDSLCEILNNLCKKYLKNSIIFTGKNTIICRVYNCFYSHIILKEFIEDFVLTKEQDINKNLEKKKLKKDMSLFSK